MKKRKPKKTANPWPPRARRLPPKDIPRDFLMQFGDLDPKICKRVAVFVDWERRYYKTRESVREIGEDLGFGVVKGFSYLMAGRFLLSKEKRLHA